MSLIVSPEYHHSGSTPKLLKHRLCIAWVIHLCQFPEILIRVTYVMQACASIIIPCAVSLSTSLHMCLCLHFTSLSSFEFYSWAPFPLRTHMEPMLSVIFLLELSWEIHFSHFHAKSVCLEKMVNAAVIINETYELFRGECFSPVIFGEFPMNYWTMCFQWKRE